METYLYTMLRHLPNALTLLNLFSGSCAVILLLQGYELTALYCLLVCGIADFLDGLVARALKVSGDLGRELDSIADTISFGLVPAAILYVLNKDSIQANSHGLSIAFVCFLIAVASGLRLALFNLDTRQHEHFIGLNTPMNTMFYAGLLVMKLNNYKGIEYFREMGWPVYACIILTCFLLLSPIRMLNFKSGNSVSRTNSLRLLFAGGVGILCIIAPILALSLTVVWYLIVSFLYHFNTLNKKTT